MGHERIGILPTSKKWRDIVDQIAGMSVSEDEVADIAQKTIRNVRDRFRHLAQDDGLLSTFEFLVNLAVASRQNNPQMSLSETGVELPENPTPLAFAKAVNEYVDPKMNSFEYGEIAQKAAGDAISGWYDQNQPTMENLLNSVDDPFEVWRKAGDGAGFCELSRLFFAKFTQRYLEYFLAREASAALRSIDDRIEFGQHLEDHVNSISRHAFETSKITQSFAAGWFNKNAREGVPSQKSIKGFLNTALGKMRDALQREGDQE